MTRNVQNVYDILATRDLAIYYNYHVRIVFAWSTFVDESTLK